MTSNTESDATAPDVNQASVPVAWVALRPLVPPLRSMFTRTDRIVAWQWWGVCGLLLVMGWGLFIRLYKLDTFFPGLYKDEADKGNEALYFFAPRPISDWFTIGTWGGVQRFQWLLTAQFLKLTSPTPYNLRLFNVLLTVVGLPVVYVIARRMRMNPFASLLSVFLLATIPWTLVESRMGWPNPVVLLTVPGAVLLALQAMYSLRWYWWIALALWPTSCFGVSSARSRFSWPSPSGGCGSW